jgi:hypothetical protein
VTDHLSHTAERARGQDLERQLSVAREALRNARNFIWDDAALTESELALIRQIDAALAAGEDRCRCGHSREAHSGHTIRPGQADTTHCSQGDSCQFWNPRP